MSESMVERAKNICAVGKSTTYPDMTSSQYVRHTMNGLLVEIARLEQALTCIAEERDYDGNGKSDGEIVKLTRSVRIARNALANA